MYNYNCIFNNCRFSELDRRIAETIRDFSPSEIAGLHNDCLAFLFENHSADFNRELSSENLVDSVSYIYEFLSQKFPNMRYSFLKETEMLKRRILESGDDNGGRSQFLNVLYSTTSLEQELSLTILPQNLQSDIVRLHSFALNGTESKSDFDNLYNQIIEKNYGQYGNYCVNCMHKVAEVSKIFWNEHQYISKVAKEYPPVGWTCDDWASFCDMLGCLLGGGPMSIFMSWAAKRDCQEWDNNNQAS